MYYKINKHYYSAGTSGTAINLKTGVISSKNFTIDSGGNVTISGQINATSGNIGGCTISNGVLTVADANIQSINGTKISGGTITNSQIASGTILGSNIGYQTISDSNIYSVNAGKITAGTIHGCDLDGTNLEYANVTVGRLGSGTSSHLQLRSL